MTEFKVFLKEELDFTTGKHYTEIGMAYGLVFGTFNPKYAIDNLLRAEIALKSTTSLLFSISP
jgi:hypothetical protein